VVSADVFGQLVGKDQDLVGFHAFFTFQDGFLLAFQVRGDYGDVLDEEVVFARLLDCFLRNVPRGGIADHGSVSTHC
jgi:hypothetical protein